MNRESLDAMLDAVRRMPSEDRMIFADEVDRLAWRDRMTALVARVAERDRTLPPISDEEIDRIADEVRTETPLSQSEQYWIHRRQSAP